MQPMHLLLRKPLLSAATRLLLAQHLTTQTSRRASSWEGSASGQNGFASSSQAWYAGAGAFGLGGFAYLAQPGAAQADAGISTPEQQVDAYARPTTSWGGLPKHVELYQYEVCPYCCKVKAALDYYKVPYSVVEVNPLTKSEVKALGHKKVPVLKVGEQLVNESSLIMSHLAAEAEQAAAMSSSSSSSSSSNSIGSTASTSLPAQRKGWFGSKAAAPAATPVAISAAGPRSSSSFSEEETRWRKWVDDCFVKTVTANIYRSWSESVDTFKYITDHTQWAWGTREAAKWMGAVIMWRVGQGLPKKYSIDGDLREALYKECNSFVDAVGVRDFLGGNQPNLGDLAVFGVLRAVSQTPTFIDVMKHSRIAPWYQRMEAAVGPSSQIVAAAT